jgi:hypothetical protein
MTICHSYAPWWVYLIIVILVLCGGVCVVLFDD